MKQLFLILGIMFMSLAGRSQTATTTSTKPKLDIHPTIRSMEPQKSDNFHHHFKDTQRREHRRKNREHHERHGDRNRERRHGGREHLGRIH